MPHPLKVFLPHTCTFITFRTREGLPFVPLKFMNMLTESAIARAQALYPVKLLMYEFEANHAHLLIEVTDPELVPLFMGYMKGEMSQYLNRLLNRRKISVWEDGYDSPIVLDHEKALEKFTYGLLNPVKDGLVHSMEAYPGVSSYKMLLKRQTVKEVKNIPRDAIIPLKDPHRPYLESREMSEYFSSDEFKTLPITVEPLRLKRLFGETRKLSDDEYQKLLLESLRKGHEKFHELREGKPPLGAANLIHTSILKPHSPPHTGKRMWVLGSSKEIRFGPIQWLKGKFAECRAVYEDWKKGKLTPYPPGFFAPRMPRLANMVPVGIA